MRLARQPASQPASERGFRLIGSLCSACAVSLAVAEHHYSITTTTTTTISSSSSSSDWLTSTLTRLHRLLFLSPSSIRRRFVGDRQGQRRL